MWTAWMLCLAVAAAPKPGPERPVDVVLDCFFLEEAAVGGGQPPGGFGGRSSTVPATLVLKQLPVPDDGALDGFTDFEGVPPAQDHHPIVFEASAPSVRIPQAQALLHADCGGEKVACEISPYFPCRGPGAAACFVGTLHVSGSGPRVSLVMRIPRGVQEGAALHPKLQLPLSPQGTVLATVEFQVSTTTATLHSRLGGSSALHCSFSAAAASGPPSVDWRLQHKGRGRGVVSWTAAGGKSQAERAGARLEPEEQHGVWDATLTLSGLTVEDEGAYICQVSAGQHKTQQIIRLSILEPPKVRLTVTPGPSFTTLTCHITGYYPLDVTVTWIQEEAEAALPSSPAPGSGPAPAPVPGSSLSSHRQNAAGTFSVSSTLRVQPGSTGASYTCQVAHVSLEEPLTATARVALPEPESTSSGLLVATGLFLFGLLVLGLRRWPGIPLPPSSTKTTPRHLG
ncbi:tapasin-related protein [Tachyglossus aculeatus]|uniref:tapasin-related protein n=1 Tax=Tachyglossus aculeatus TaxID=9261 RepID=UPI0018F6B837|nr:tapasin-related protein [Tachyglossus aculeatus]